MNVRRSSCKVSVFLVRFWSNVKFFDRFSKNPQTSNFMKNSLVGDYVFHADGMTDRHDKDNIHFLHFFERA